MQAIGRLTGPSEPGPAPMAARISASDANTSGLATSGWLAALISLSS